MFGDSHNSTQSTKQSRNNSLEVPLHLPHQGGLHPLLLASSEDVLDETTSSQTSSNMAAFGIIIYDSTTTTTQQQQQTPYQCQFSRADFDFCQRLFAILDTENKGYVAKTAVQEFTTLRCPVFWRRDEDLRRLSKAAAATTTTRSTMATSSSPTFDEIWNSVVTCAATTSATTATTTALGVEGWLVFCRFIALAQYLEAKRRFSARHLQQTMKHRNAPRGSELVVVDVPPPQAPSALTIQALMECETRTGHPLPLPELDLDHSLLAIHDVHKNNNIVVQGRLRGVVQVSLLGRGGGGDSGSGGGSINSGAGNGSGNWNNSNAALDFAIAYHKNERNYAHAVAMTTTRTNTTVDTSDESNAILVRRSMADLRWLDESFATQKGLGGTLCGRILPSFPVAFDRDDANNRHGGNTTTKLLVTSQQTISKAAKKSVGKIKSAAKSLWGTTLQAGSYAGQVLSSMATPSSSNEYDDAASTGSATSIGTPNSSSAAGATATTASASSASSLPPRKSSSRRHANPSCSNSSWDSFYNAQAPTAKARQLERYLNFLLEHPALSTSFPLNTILMASQSGLDAAKKALYDCAKANHEIREQTPRLDDGKLRVPFLSVHEAADYGWVRTAAQAAIALRIHGMLETTGMPSASARLQHASLPVFSVGRRWADDLINSEHQTGSSQAGSASGDAPAVPLHVGFEDGVVQVSSELRKTEPDLLGIESHGLNDPGGDDDGYDMLPLPVPAPERRILMAGSNTQTASGQAMTRSTTSALSSQETRFHYGSASLPENFLFQDDESAVLLGSISIDDNIDKLREVIGSVDNTLRRCLASGGGIGKVRRDRNSVQLNVVKGFDSWEGMRGQFVSQRSLLKGVNGLEQSKQIFEEGDLFLIDDLSWQSSLARSAVTAAEDVRSAVRASNTAANAKAAASNAAMAAQNACDSGNFANIEEARAAQTRASIAQSHAIHAAVVDHEAKSVKRRAAVALANDVKCWNVHRKRELLRSTLMYAKSQHEATRRAVDAWSCLRDGYIGSVVMPPMYDRRAVTSRATPKAPKSSSSSPSSFLGDMFDPMGTAVHYTAEPNEVKATIFGGSSTCESPPIVAVEHDLLHPQPPTLDLLSGSIPKDFFDEASPSISTSSPCNNVFDETPPAMTTTTPQPAKDPSPADDSSDDEASKSTTFFESHTLLPFAMASPIPEEHKNSNNNAISAILSEEADDDPTESEYHDSATDNPMTASMQSLVDGLMSWGGAIDIDEELVLPRGMAASIAFEESSTSAKSP